MRLRFRADFAAFQLLSSFVDEFMKAQGLPPFYVPAKPETHRGIVLTAAAGDCIHSTAKKIADELVKQQYQSVSSFTLAELKLADEPLTPEDAKRLLSKWGGEEYGTGLYTDWLGRRDRSILRLAFSCPKGDELEMAHLLEDLIKEKEEANAKVERKA